MANSTKISEYSTTAANNTSIDSIDIDENCAASGINNAIRSVLKHQADAFTQGTPIALDQTNNRVGIGLTAPTKMLDVAGDARFGDTACTVTIDDTNGVKSGSISSSIRLHASGSEVGLIGYATSVGDMGITNDGGDIAIGADQDDSDAGSVVRFLVDGSEQFRIGSALPASGNNGLYSDADGLYIVQNTSQIDTLALQSQGTITYQTNFDDGTSNADHIFKISSTTEAMRLDDSGNLLVGKSTTVSNTAGHSIYSSGAVEHTRDSNSVLYVNRTSTDGAIAEFRKDGSTVGSIGNDGTNFFISGTADGAKAGILFSASKYTPMKNAVEVDNAVDIGSSGKRYDDIFATNGTIQTSDQNEKEQIASLTTAEITAAKAISKLFKTFKWQDKVAAKGDAARTHTGVIAQEVQTAMTDAGLDASKYAFWCSDTWWETSTDVPAVEADEEAGIEARDAYTRVDTYDTADEAPEGATERTRLGIRYPELLAFIGAATEQRLADIETRLTALEA